MVSFSQVIVIIAVSWLIIISLASRYDLQKFNIFISTGVLIWESARFEQLLKKINQKLSFWSELSNISTFFALLLFFATPIILLVNLLKGVFFIPTPILFTNPFTVLRVEIFILAIPAIFIVISIHQIVRAITYLDEDGKVESMGIIVLGVVITFFSNLNIEKLSSNSKSKVLSISLIINMLVLLVSLPIFSASMAVVGSIYDVPSGAIILTVAPNSPADDVGIINGQIILGLKFLENNQIVSETNITSAAIFRAKLRQIPPGVEFILVLDTTQVSIIGEVSNSNQPFSGPYIGLQVTDYYTTPGYMPVLLPLWTETFFNWLLNFSIIYGLYVILPLPKSDGSKLLDHVANTWNIKISPKAKRFIQVTALLLLALNILLV